jgi:hypothetical protein
MNEIPFEMNGVIEVWRVYFVQRKGTIVGRRGRQALILPSVDRFLVLLHQVAHPDRVGGKRTLIKVTVVEDSKLLILPSADRLLVLFDQAKRTLIDVTVVEDSKLLILPSVTGGQSLWRRHADRLLVLFHQVWYIPTVASGTKSNAESTLILKINARNLSKMI